MSTANHRDNRFELARLFQGPNGVGVVMIERNVAGSRPPPRELSDDDIDKIGGPGALEAVIKAFGILEIVYAAKHEEAEASLDPKETHRKLQEAIAAEQRTQIATLESQRLELELIAKRAELEQLEAEAAKAAKAAKRPATR